MKQSLSTIIATCALLCALPIAYSQSGVSFGSNRLSKSIKRVGRTRNESGEYISRQTLTPVERSKRMEFTVTLPLRNLAELKARVANHERFSVADLDALYFPREADYRRVRGWLAAHGLRADQEDLNRTTIKVSGTVDEIASALQTKFAIVTTANGEFTSAIEDPVLPSDIGDTVLAITGIQPHLKADPAFLAVNNLQTSSDLSVHPTVYRSNGGIGYITGTDIRTFYNAPANLTGAGQTVAIIMWAPVASSDLASFNSYVGNSFTGSFTDINVATPPSGKNNNTPGVLEANLDVETIASVVPAANIRLYSIADGTVSSILNGLNRVVSDIRSGTSITVLSMSFVGGEQEIFMSNDMAAMDQVFVTLSALGVTNIAASGDKGALANNGVNRPMFPASDPFVTAVGGTNFHTDITGPLYANVNNALAASDYIGESVTYTGSSSPVDASGSGKSTYFPKPTWQVGSGTFLGSQTSRCYPDVAGPWGYLVNHTTHSDVVGNANYPAVGFGVMYTNIDSLSNASQFVIMGGAGTSLATPVWAGIVAMINQNRGGAGPVGFLNPWLYEVAQNTPWNAVRDQAGNFPNVYFSAQGVWTTYPNWNGTYYEGAGYDLATGLGSPNIANLASALQSPTFVVQPQSQTINVGGTVVFSAFAESSPYLIAPSTYQWFRNGSAIAGITNPQLQVSNSDTQLSNNGDQYRCVVTLSNSQSANSTITTSTATLSVVNTSSPGRVVNLSSRANVVTGNSVLIGGFTISGSGYMPVLVRAIGPTLAAFGVSGVLPDPTLNVYQGSTQFAYNFPWGGSSVLSNAFNTVGAFSLGVNSNDSAALFASGQATPARPSLAAGGYSCVVQGNSSGTGVALCEVYDANAVVGATWTSGMPFLSNISTRAFVSPGDKILVGGFVVSGSTSKTLLIRATGPTLSTFGLSGLLPDPRITLFDSNGNAIASNEIWDNNPLISSASNSVGAFGWSASSNDSAIIVTVPPGTYSAQIQGGNGDSGIALLEIYAVP